MTYIKEQDLCLTYYVNVSIVKQSISLSFVNYFLHEAQLSGAQLLGAPLSGAQPSCHHAIHLITNLFVS